MVLYRLRRHPFPVNAHFDDCLVLTYALPAELLATQLPPGLELDTFGQRDEWGFLAIALVQTRRLRPAYFPAWMGRDFFLSGYRIFARFRSPEGTLRGLRILRSNTDRLLMKIAGNLLTHYNYCRSVVQIERTPSRVEFHIQTPGGEADLEVAAMSGEEDAPLPHGSCFGSLREARRFAGPLPYTFDYEPQTHSIVVIKGVRRNWHPRQVTVEVRKSRFFEQPPFDATEARLASAFHVRNVPYRWERGIRYALRERSR